VRATNVIDPRSLRGDLAGGLTAAVVALPLALAFGVSSGLGPVAGLYGAIVVGFVAALFGGTPTQISGPTGPMTVVVAGLVAQIALDGDAGAVFTVIVLAGVMQIALGLSGLGRFLIQVSYPVISGFMSGIGVIIVALEVEPLLGGPGASSVGAALDGLPAALAAADPAATGLGLAALALLFAWRGRANALLPSPLLVLVLGTVATATLPVLAGVPVIGAIPSGLPTPVLPDPGDVALRTIVTSALLLAALGSIDTLLTSLVADDLTRTQHDTRRELVGQGLGNAAAGFLGALPGAGATMRTVVNVRAGGRSATSGMVHALLLLAVALGAGTIAEQVPLAVLAAILLKVGIDIVDWRFLARLPRLPLTSAGLMLLVLGLTVFVDLVTAVVVGVFVANMITLDRLTDVQLDGLRLETVETDAGTTVVLALSGPMSFGVARGLKARIAAVPDHDRLVIDLREARLVGLTTAMTLEDLVAEEQQAGRRVSLAGLDGAENRRALERLGVLDRVPEDERYADREAALAA
jgi:SulP family sulfate permease